MEKGVQYDETSLGEGLTVVRIAARHEFYQHDDLGYVDIAPILDMIDWAAKKVPLLKPIPLIFSQRHIDAIRPNIEPGYASRLTEEQLQKPVVMVEKGGSQYPIDGKHRIVRLWDDKREIRGYFLPWEAIIPWTYPTVEALQESIRKRVFAGIEKATGRDPGDMQSLHSEVTVIDPTEAR